jgi:hypothetical protein
VEERVIIILKVIPDVHNARELAGQAMVCPVVVAEEKDLSER